MKEGKEILEFGPYRLDAAEAQLTRLGEAVGLPPKVFDLLVYLASNAGRLVEKEELLRALWPDAFVEEANLTVNVAALRRALGPAPDGANWIETVPKRGYRFAAAVKRSTVQDVPPETEASQPPATAAASETVPPPARVRPRLIALALVVVLTVCGVLLVLRLRRAARDGVEATTVAVLPFEDLTPQADEAAGLGMTDALITKLASLPDLVVRPLPSVREFAGKGVDVLSAGRQLGVNTVVTGAIQRIDKRVRVTVRLIRVSDGQSLWAEKYDEFFTNIFAVQDAITEKLVQALLLRLSTEEQDRLLRRHTESTEAYRWYARGKASRLSETRNAVEYFKRAIAEDARYALPWVDLAEIYLSLSGNGIRSYEKYAPLAKEAVERALALGPDVAEAHAAAADYQRIATRDRAAARRELEQAMRLNPRSPVVHSSMSAFLATAGEVRPAMEEARQAHRLDPLSADRTYDLAFLLYVTERCQEAVAAIDALERTRQVHQAVWIHFYCDVMSGRYMEAIDRMKRYDQERGPMDAAKAALAIAYAKAGHAKEAEELLARLTPGWGEYQRAVVYHWLGRNDEAVEHLDLAVDERNVWVEWLRVDPLLAGLRMHPKFAATAARLGL
ncbi:MAG: winged helix-turn-helix domain-containing protein [Bryobacteraceae bacterium]|nr:winged helix-turn-helix domain-containing protein [Bryobacteraceae bacterium]